MNSIHVLEIKMKYRPPESLLQQRTCKFEINTCQFIDYALYIFHAAVVNANCKKKNNKIICHIYTYTLY